MLTSPSQPVDECSQDLDQTDKSFACTYEHQFSNSQKLVEVKLQHKALCTGLESEHWWVLSNRCYSVFGNELPPQYSGCAYAVAYIKRFGTSIREAKAYLHTESAITSVQNITLQTKVCKTNKCVFIGSDGHSWSHESSDTHILETAAPCVYPTRRPGPPPGF
ncbi:hypothetical protein NFI96_024156 [Prochilodus magdalenae]|nr:hypothetical protein NFI96_024156 [Prochilodus magdalenae]